MLPIDFLFVDCERDHWHGQGQMSMATLTIDKYRNNLVGIIETKPIYLDQTCDTWLPLTRKLCLLHKRSRSQLTYVGLNRNAFLCIAPVIHVYYISIKKEINIVCILCLPVYSPCYIFNTVQCLVRGITQITQFANYGNQQAIALVCSSYRTTLHQWPIFIYNIKVYHTNQ